MVKEPESIDQVIYFTQRSIGKGSVKAWVYKGMCTVCKKGLMSKPVDEKTGKVKIRAKEYVCPACHHTVEKKKYEESLQCEIAYTCPSCGNKSDISVPFKRKKFEGMDAIVFQCEKCNAKIPITKKMKEKGKE